MKLDRLSQECCSWSRAEIHKGLNSSPTMKNWLDVPKGGDPQAGGRGAMEGKERAEQGDRGNELVRTVSWQQKEGNKAEK